MNELEVFTAALELADSAARDKFLDQECVGNAELRARLDALIRNAAHASRFLESPPTNMLATLDGLITERVGTQIGPYKLLEQIGEGGMGVVYMAQQSEPVKRRVALKLIKPGMDTRQVIARFEAERQALALMDHPHIARVLDAGATEAGRPYFVMELVYGVPITEYCDREQLDTRQRLELLIDVCRAVQHAHQKAIIHRDLKPNNVLVTLHDGEAVVKVIDFGVAKALDQELTERTLFTQFTQMVGTPLYMSPEQATSNAVDVDTRSDIYSLGVLLYELLTGTTPFERDLLKNAGWDELRRIIREDDPPRPSERISTLHAAGQSTVSRSRYGDPRKLSQQLRGELDWIVMKSLEKDRHRRYESASAFAADIQSYLNDEPVFACPPSAFYRLRKFARRRKAALTATVFVLGALIVGTTVATWQAIEASHSRKLANERFVLANQRLTNEQRARADEEKQHKQAVANMQAALDVIDQMFLHVGNESLSDVPHVEPIQREVLEEALTFYRQLLRENPSDRNVRHRTALALYRTSFLYGYGSNISTSSTSIARLSEAKGILGDLREEFSQDPRYVYDLATVEISLSWYRKGDADHAVKLLEPMVSSPPENLRFEDLLVTNRPHRCAVVPLIVDRIERSICVASMLRCQLADAYRSRTVPSMDRSDLVAAEADYRMAIAIAESAPGWNQQILAWCYTDLAEIYAAEDRQDDALAAIGHATACRQELLASQPGVVAFREWYVVDQLRHSKLLEQFGRNEEATIAIRAGLDAVHQLHAEFPTEKFTKLLFDVMEAAELLGIQ